MQRGTNMKCNIRKGIWLGATAAAGFLALLSGMFLNPVNHFLLAALLVAVAVCLYFLQVFLIADRNWLDFRAVFSGVWLGTIGLAVLRLAEYQTPWESKTWFLLAIAYLMLQLGVTLGLALAPAVCDKTIACAKKFKLGRLQLKWHPNRLFGLCVITTLIGLACFSINIAIKGFIPAFSNIYNAYTVFYTKFHVFSVAAVAVAPLCYYCIATQPLGLFKKIILGLCIFYLVFAFPILAVSRGVFIVAALGLAVCVYYLHDKRLWVLILSIAVIGGCYMFASELRNYTDEQMQIYFQPAQIQLPGSSNNTTPSDPTDSTDGTSDTDSPNGDNGTTVGTFSLSPKMAFVYSYLTVSHDNFNEAVAHTTEHTWGARQMIPFNVILRSQRLEDKVADVTFYQVSPLLNTINVIGDFFYDFGTVGVILCMLLWCVIFGIVQGFYERNKNIFILLILGNTMVPVAMCFFSTWLSNFTHWMIWGVALLLATAAYATLSLRKDRK